MKKRVVIRMSIDMIVEVPSDWTPHEIEFFYNDSLHCLGTEIEALYRDDQKASEENRCFTCHRSDVRFLRIAEDADEERLVL